MILEAVIVCVNYSDFLAHTLPLNKHHFDKMVVVTSLTDHETKKVCEYHHVTCIQTDIFYENGASFAKAKGINKGLESLTQDGWVLHLDSDVVLPPQFRRTLEPLDLDPSYLYGVDRLMCTSYKDWADNMRRPFLTQENEIFIHLNSGVMPVGTRVAKYATEIGFIPIGFFQLWNPKVSKVSKYPHEHGDAGRTDMLFAYQWPRNKRGFIPEIVTIHLESEKLDKMGKNWQGRKTKIFGPAEESVEEIMAITHDVLLVVDEVVEVVESIQKKNFNPMLEEYPCYTHDELDFDPPTQMTYGEEVITDYIFIGLVAAASIIVFLKLIS